MDCLLHCELKGQQYCGSGTIGMILDVVVAKNLGPCLEVLGIRIRVCGGLFLSHLKGMETLIFLRLS